MKRHQFYLTLAILSFIGLVIISTYAVIDSVNFDRGCEGHLKRAADANSIELAQQELQIAIDYIEDNNLTEGYTSVLYTTPDEDLGYWYSNLSQANNELINMINDGTATNLEKSNMLIKLRETLIDHKGGDTGDKVTVPAGASRYPNNATYGWIWLVTSLGICIFFPAALFSHLD